MSSISSDPHFDTYQYETFDVFRHRPHKTALHFFRALSATAVFRIWPSLVFTAAWATMVVLVNEKTDTKLEFPNTMITVLGKGYRKLPCADTYRCSARPDAQLSVGNLTISGRGLILLAPLLLTKSTLKDARCGRRSRTERASGHARYGYIVRDVHATCYSSDR